MTRVVRRCTASTNYAKRDGGNITTPWHCTCLLFSINGSCGHVNEVRDEVCMWSEADSPIKLGSDPTVCPMCGSPTAATRLSEE